jgi:hypothetical protein
MTQAPNSMATVHKQYANSSEQCINTAKTLVLGRAKVWRGPYLATLSPPSMLYRMLLELVSLILMSHAGSTKWWKISEVLQGII